MRPVKRIPWTAVVSVCLGLGAIAVVGALLFFVFGNPRTVNPGAALSELMDWKPPKVVTGSAAPQPTARPTAPVVAAPQGQPRVDEANADAEERVPAVVVLAALPEASATVTAPVASATVAAYTTAAATNLAVTAPSTTAATTTAALGATDTEPDLTGSTTGDTETAAEGDAVPAADPPPGAAQGVTYCGAMTCFVGLKCCCDSCVPFEQECNPRSCAAQSGLSISVPCGMDLCDPGEVCCDARCGECAPMGQCPETPCE